jgi:hypothetical protein
MWSVIPNPDCARPEDVATETFVTAVRARYPDAHVVVNDLDDPTAARVTVVGSTVSCSLLRRPASLGIKAAANRRALIGLVRWFRELIPVTTPLQLLEYESGLTVVPVTADTANEALYPAVGDEDW